MKCNTWTKTSSTIGNNHRHLSKMMTRNQNQGNHASIVGNSNTTRRIVPFSKEKKEKTNSKEDLTKLEVYIAWENDSEESNKSDSINEEETINFVLWLIKERRKR